jgi:predicted dehydrogenase
MIRDGILGKVTQILAEMPQDGFIRVDREGRTATPQAWRLKDPETVSTVSLDLGTHVHQIIYFLTGARPLTVVAAQDTFGRFDGVVDNAVSLARYTGGLCCSLWYGKAALGHRNGLRMRVYGTEGSAEWHQMEPEVLRFCDRHGVPSSLDRTTSFSGLPGESRYNRFKAGHPAGFIEAFANYYRDIADSLAGYGESGGQARDSEWVFGADVAEEGLHMLEAIARSSATGAWERVCG